MAKINLLPWRAERRKLREREFFTLIGVAAGASALAVFLWSYQYSRRIDDQLDRNAYVTQEIAGLDAKIAEIEKLDKYKEKLLARKEAIEKLQSNRSRMVHLFDDLVRTLPDGISLTGIKQEGDLLTLEGVSESNARVATYLRNFEKSESMVEPELEVTEKKGPNQRSQYVFKLRVKMKKADGEGEEGEEGTEGAAGTTAGAAK